MKVGRWTIYGIANGCDKNTFGEKTRLLCICDCGVKRDVSWYALKYGRSKSCGCFQKQEVKQRFTKHGHAPGNKRSRVYMCWVNMLKRCRNQKDPNYKNYGVRGITVCERWHTFENFIADMGEPAKGMSIERRDVNGNYEPSNCEWTDYISQQNNRRDTHLIEWNGRHKTIAQWARIAELAHNTFRGRLAKGWSMDKIMTTPPTGRNQYTKRQ